MSKAYSVLKSAPVKIGVGITWLIGVLAFIMPDETRKQIFGPLWTPAHFLLASFGLLILSNIYTLVLWLLKPTTVEATLPGPAPAPAPAPALPELAREPERPRANTADVTEALHGAFTNNALLDANCPLEYVLVRAYKKLGGSPDDPNQKMSFYTKVDRHLGDMVSLRNMSVWGRYMDTPLRPIFNKQNIRFDHRNKRILVASDALQAMIFTDLTFNKAQVDAAWPKLDA